jgi:hypothetical protein
MITSADCPLLTVVDSSISKLYTLSPTSQLPTVLVVTRTGRTLISVISFGTRDDEEDEGDDDEGDDDEGDDDDESDESDELDSEEDEPDEFEEDDALDSDDDPEDEPLDEPLDDPLASEEDEADGLDSEDRLEDDREPSPDREDLLEPSAEARLGDSLGAGPPGIRHRLRAVLPSSMEQVNTTTSPGLTSIILCKFTVSEG